MAGLGQSGSAQVVNMNGYKQVQAAQPVQNKGNFFTHLLPTIAGTGGGIAGGAAGGALAGTAILPGIGTVAGGLLGALLGGAAGGAGGKVLENKVEHQSLGNGVLGAGIENGVLSAGPLRLLKGGAALAGAGKGLAESLIAPAAAHEAGQIAGDTALKAAEQPLKTSVTGKLESWGNNQLAKQWGTLDKPTIRATNPGQTVGQLADMGITKPLDAERIAAGITGTNGVVNNAVVKAVGASAHVPTSGVADVLENSIIDRNLSGLPQEKTVTALVNSQLKKLGDTPTASKVFDTMKRLEKQAADLEGAGGNAKMTDPTRGDMAQVYRDVRDHLQEELYKGAGANANVSKVLTPEVRQNLLDLHPNNDQWQQFVDSKVMNAKTIGELRSAQAPFVNASKMIDNADANSFSMGGKIGNMLSAGGIKNAAVNMAANVVKDPALRVAGVTARKMAGSEAGGASGLLGALSAPGAKSVIRNEALLGAPMAMADGGKASAAPLDPSQPQQGYSADQLSQMQADPTRSGQVATAQDPSQSADASSPLNPANVEQGIQAILAGGGKMSDVTAYVDLVKTVSAMQGSGTPKALNSTQQQQAFNAQSGLTSLNDIAAALQKNPNEAKLAALPGGSLTSSLTGTGSYKAAIANATDVIGRLRSGGAIGAEEEKQFKALLPQSFDSQQTAAYKLNQLQTLFSQFANPQAAASDPLTLLSALGGQ